VISREIQKTKHLLLSQTKTRPKRRAKKNARSLARVSFPSFLSVFFVKALRFPEGRQRHEKHHNIATQRHHHHHRLKMTPLTSDSKYKMKTTTTTMLLYLVKSQHQRVDAFVHGRRRRCFSSSWDARATARFRQSGVAHDDEHKRRLFFYGEKIQKKFFLFLSCLGFYIIYRV
jgi:hypothetical protein